MIQSKAISALVSCLLLWSLSSIPWAQALCNCGVSLAKSYAEGDYNSGKTILVRIGCNDEQMKTECLAAKREVEDFVSSLMEFIDDTYVRPSLDLVNRLLVADKLPMEDYSALRDVIVRQRNAASEAVENRIHPDCASGLWTESLYSKNATLRNTYEHWTRWNLNEIRDNALCVSRYLERELLELQAEHRINRTLRLDETKAGPLAPKVNEVLLEVLEGDDHKGLTPYSKRMMEQIVFQRNDTVGDIAGLGISTGRDFVRYFLLRAISEPPDVRLPATELSAEGQLEQGDLGDERVCFPLNSTVLVSMGNKTYALKQLADLQLKDQVVTGSNSPHAGSKQMIATSPVVDFAHRLDTPKSRFLNVRYASTDGTTKTVTASANHNVLFGVFHGQTETIETHHKSFGVLRQYFDDGHSVYVKNGLDRWMSVREVDASVESGYVAPITKEGTMAIVPPEAAKDLGTSLDGAQALNVLSQSTVVSTFSSVPDTVGYSISATKLLFYGPSPNKDGAGSGEMFDTATGWAQSVSKALGHLASQ
ncbi:expressed unknown protein [Seminavis robusta]|uniref:Hedgehog protein Hint domain-containing protein n=1 Tax=Seminavis robusta TaxID=568900 RepID=A0A9N8HAL9_9STRA|nr:expressed unknown protein [Seminavis robusta]|eukprot:Sro153_g069770.1 n/a (536) ;mRNA; f:65050-66657